MISLEIVISKFEIDFEFIDWKYFLAEHLKIPYWLIRNTRGDY